MGRTYAGLNLVSETVKRNKELWGDSNPVDWFWVTEQQLLGCVPICLRSAEKLRSFHFPPSSLLSHTLCCMLDFILSLWVSATVQISVQCHRAWFVHRRELGSEMGRRARQRYVWAPSMAGLCPRGTPVAVRKKKELLF